MKKLTMIFVGILIMSCLSQKKDIVVPEISDLADLYYKKVISTAPQYSYFMDIPLEDHSKYGSNSLTAIRNWENFEDSLYNELVKIDQSKITERKDQITYWLLKEKLESSIELRVCKQYLWSVNHMDGLHLIWTNLSDFQPVGNDTLRNQAFDRWNKLPEIVSTEIDNLRTGVENGYTMPKEIVKLVIEQLQTLIDYPLENSPFMSPAKRDDDENFKTKWKDLVKTVVLPAFRNYLSYLKTEYLNSARDEVSILSIPNGSDCYQAYIRSRTTTIKTGYEIFNQGLEIVNKNKREIQELGQELYSSSDFSGILGLIKGDSSNYFTTSDEILNYDNQILDEAERECLNWFDKLPSSGVKIKPFETYESGFGGYDPEIVDKPALFRINLKKPRSQTYYENEKLTIHETYPGHHLQIGLEKDMEGLHPIRKMVRCGSYIEGWARYSEQLAEEMGLYKQKASLISRRSWPARGMVIDPGLHLKSWPKDSVISFMMESGTNKEIALNLYHRIIVLPAQLTSYDVGGEEIKALRKMAEEKLGDIFNIKEFHTKILENGSIPLIPLRKVIEEWIEHRLSITLK